MGPGDREQDARLRESGIPLFARAPYLVNLGSGDPVAAERSAGAVAHETPGGKAGHARDIALLKELRDALAGRAV